MLNYTISPITLLKLSAFMNSWHMYILNFLFLALGKHMLKCGWTMYVGDELTIKSSREREGLTWSDVAYQIANSVQCGINHVGRIMSDTYSKQDDVHLNYHIWSLCHLIYLVRHHIRSYKHRWRLTKHPKWSQVLCNTSS